MKPFFNFRNLALVALTVLLLAIKFLTDPTAGAVTYEFLIYLTTPILVVLAGHWLRKLLFPYVSMEDLYESAKTSTVGSAITFLGMCLFVMAIYGLFGPSARAQDVNTYIPAGAKTYLPMLQLETAIYWPDLPKKHISPV